MPPGDHNDICGRTEMVITQSDREILGNDVAIRKTGRAGKIGAVVDDRHPKTQSPGKPG